jgi:hypothetical protein
MEFYRLGNILWLYYNKQDIFIHVDYISFLRWQVHLEKWHLEIIWWPFVSWSGHPFSDEHSLFLHPFAQTASLSFVSVYHQMCIYIYFMVNFWISWVHEVHASWALTPFMDTWVLTYNFNLTKKNPNHYWLKKMVTDSSYHKF